MRPSQEELGAGEVGGLWIGFDEILGQLDDFLVTVAVVGLEHFFAGISGGILGPGAVGQGEGQKQSDPPDPVPSVHTGKS